MDIRQRERAAPRDYVFAFAVLAACTMACQLLFAVFEPANLVMVYLLGVLVVAARGKPGPAALTSVMGVLCFDFFFISPRFTLRVSDVQYLWTMGVMFATAMAISRLAVRLRRETEAAREAHRRTELMRAFTQKLSAATSPEDILRLAVQEVSDFFRSPVMAFIPDGRGGLKAALDADAPGKDLGVAQWVFDSGQSAGPGEPSLPDAEALYIPLRGAETPSGVLRVAVGSLPPESRELLDAFAQQAGLSLEVTRLARSARTAELEAASERLRSSLLSSVSHDFRTPLAAILGSADALLAKAPAAPERELLDNIRDEADRLSRLVQNLLQATRLESGAVGVEKELTPLEDVVGGALERLEKAVGLRDVAVDIPADLPPVPMDGVLVEQALYNLLENAARHAPAAGAIDLSARREGEDVIVAVGDRGPGVRAGDRESIFGKFTRGPGSSGAGLGLAICRAVVGAHGGRIWVEDRPGGGALFRFALPLGEKR